MTGPEPHYDDQGITSGAVELLRRHEAQEPEAHITSTVRTLPTITARHGQAEMRGASRV